MSKIFRSPYFWINILGVILLIGIWFLLPVLGVKSLTLKAAIGLFCFSIVLLLNLLVVFLRLRSSSSDKSQEMAAFSEQGQIDPARMEEIRSQVRNAYNILKQAGKGKQKFGKDPLQLFRFHLVLGNSASGKSTLLQSSGLHFGRVFPSDDEAARQISPPLKWWMSNRGVFLETPAQLLDQGAESEFTYWLKSLDREKKGKELDGIILTVSLEELIHPTMPASQLADSFRESVNKVLTTLKLDLPVYMVFTNTDLIPGFEEFFQSYSDTEKNQVFGATFPVTSFHGGLVRAKFEKEFDRLVNSLEDNMLERLSETYPSGSRSKIYMFPQELASAKEKLAIFIEGLCKQSLRKERLLFRGFFFSSTVRSFTQSMPLAGSSGQSQTILSHPLNPRAASSKPEPQNLSPDGPMVSYFGSSLFQNVLPRDGSLARTPVYRQGLLSRKAFMGAGITALVSLLLLGYFTFGFIHSRTVLERSGNAVVEAAKLNWKNTSDFKSEFSTMHELYEVVKKFYEYKSSGTPWTIPPGFLKVDETFELASSMYDYQIRKMVALQSLQSLRATIGYGTEYFQNRQDLYQNLRIYLLWTEEGKSHRRIKEFKELGEAYSRLWTLELADEVGRQNFPLNFEALLEKHAMLYAELMYRNYLRPYPSDGKAIQNARNTLGKQLNLDVLFREAADKFQAEPITYEDAGVPSDAILKSSATVPRFYSKAAHDQALNTLTELSKEPLKKDWVLGDAAQKNLSQQLKGGLDLLQELRQRYYDRYAEAWDGYLRSAKIEMPPDLQAMARKLSAYTSNNQGLPAVLQKVSQETDLVPEQSILEEQVGKKMKRNELSRHAFKKWEGRGDPREQMKEDFSILTKLVAPSGGGALNNYFTSVQQLADALAQAAMGEGKDAAYKMAQELISNKYGHPLIASWIAASEALEKVPDDMKVWLKPLLEEPLYEVGKRLIEISENKLSQAYKDQVFREWTSKFDGRYPFTENSQKEASAEQLQNFFNPQDGTLFVFLKEHAEPFLKWQTRSYTLAHWQGLKPRITPAGLKTLSEGRLLSEKMFAPESRQWKTFASEIKLSEPPNIAGISMRIGADKMELNKGEGIVRKRFQWPGNEWREGAGLVARFVDGSKVEKIYDGPWGLLRLLDASRFQLQDGGFQAFWKFTVSGKYDVNVGIEANVYDPVNPFTNPDFYSFHCASEFIGGDVKENSDILSGFKSD